MSGVIDSAKLTLKLDVLQLSALDLGAAQYPLTLDWSALLGNGTGYGQASQLWADTRSLAGSVAENLDLSGVLTNAFGVSVAFTKIMLILIRARNTNNAGNPVNVQRAASAGVALFLAASDGASLGPGAIFLRYDPSGVTVTPTTADILTITNGAGTFTIDYDIVILGTD